MVRYTCDVCGQVAASATKVDRYGLTLDLCSTHLFAWVNAAQAALTKDALGADEAHGLARSLMDALVTQKGRELFQGPGDAAPQVRNNPAKGIQELHAIIQAFVDTEKAKG